MKRPAQAPRQLPGRGCESGATITGYRLLGELIGDDVRRALLRLRGGGDPDAFDALLGQIAYAKLGSGRPDVYLDFSTGPHAAVMCEPPALIRHFHPHPHYPTVSRCRRASRFR